MIAVEAVGMGGLREGAERGDGGSTVARAGEDGRSVGLIVGGRKREREEKEGRSRFRLG